MKEAAMLENPYYHNEDSKEERRHLRVWVGRVLAGIAGLLFVCWATGVFAQVTLHVLDKQGVEIRLMDGPCVDPVSVSLIRPEYLSRFKSIESMWPEKDGTRKPYKGCWAEFKKSEVGTEEDVYLLIFEDRSSGAVPKSEFRKKVGA